MNNGMRNCIFLCLLAMLLNSAIARNQHLVCRAVEDVFSENEQDRTHQETERQSQEIQGRPGKRGPIGPRGMAGSQGMKGEAGYVDYSNISEIIQEKVGERFEAIVALLDELKKNVSEISRDKQELVCGVSDLQYNGICYRVPHYSLSRDLNRESAIQSCRNIGFEIAEVHDKKQQAIVEEFIRSTYTGSKQFWIGMTFNINTKMLRYRSGKQVEADHLVWYPSYPVINSRYEYVMFNIRDSGNDGVFNFPDYQASGVICERNV